MNIEATDHINPYLNNINNDLAVNNAEKTDSSPKVDELKPSSSSSENMNMDTYTPSSGVPEEPATYKLESDENGQPKITFKQSPEATSIPKGEDNTTSKTTVVDTNNVDNEIEKLKEKKQELKEKLQNTTNESERKSLEAQLAQLAAELTLKNNDAYRKANAIYS